METICPKCQYQQHTENEPGNECEEYYLVPKECTSIQFNNTFSREIEIYISVYLESDIRFKRGICIEKGKYALCLCNLELEERERLKLKVLSKTEYSFQQKGSTLILIFRPSYIYVPTLLELSNAYYNEEIPEYHPKHLIEMMGIKWIKTEIITDRGSVYHWIYNCYCEKPKIKAPMKYRKYYLENSDEEIEDSD